MSEPSNDHLREIEKHTAFLRRMALRLAGRDDADDLLQETLLVGMTRPPHTPRSIAAWLVGVMRRLFLENRRAASRRRDRESAGAVAETGIDPARIAEHRALLSALSRSMCALAKEQYEVVMLRYFDGRTPAEIAVVLDLPLSTVKRRLDRAMAQLRAELGRTEPRWRSMLLPFLGLAKFSAAEAAAVGASTKIGTLGAMAVAKKATAAAFLFLIFGIGLVWYVESRDVSDDSMDGTISESGDATKIAEPRRFAEAPTSKPEAAAESQASGFDPLALADRDLDVFGTVVDEHDRPIAGARVTSLRLPWQRVSVLNVDDFYETRKIGESVTDHAGRFILRHRRGELVDLEVSAQGFARRAYRHRSAGERCKIVLFPACPFSIRVVDEMKNPVASAEVSIRGMTDDPINRRVTTGDRRKGTTDAKGIFPVSDLRPMSITVEVEHPRFGQKEWSDFVVGKPGESFTIELSVGKTLRGRVVDAATGNGIPRARVGEGWTLSRAVICDDDGFFELHGWVGESTMDLAARADGYGSEEVVVGASPSEIIFRLYRGAEASGRLVDRRGHPIAGALVSMWATHHAGRSVDARSTKSGADGRFILKGVRHDGPSRQIVFVADGFGRSTFVLPAAGESGTRLDLGDIALDDAATIEGRVLEADGRPIDDVRVELFGANADVQRLLEPGVAIRASLDYGCTETRRTDDLGRFRFPDLAPGDYRLTATRRGQPPIVESVKLTADLRLPSIEIRFPSTRPLTVRVEDDRGAPVKSIDIDLTRPRAGGGEGPRVRTNDDGEAQFFGIEDGEKFAIEVLFYGQPYIGETTHRFKRDRDRFVVRLKRAASISGKAVFSGGRPAAAFRIVAVAKDDSDASALTDAEGRFSILVDPGVAYRLQCFGRRIADSGDYETTRWRGSSLPVTAPAEGVLVELDEVAIDRSLTVRVEHTDGRPAKGAHVLLTRYAAGQVSTDANEEGIAIFKGLAAESVRLSAYRDDLDEGETIPAPVEIVPDGQEVRLSFRTTRVHEGSVLTADGRAAGGAVIEATAEDGSAFGATADDHGRFRIPLVAELSYQFRLFWESPDGEIGRAKIAARPLKDLDFRLDPE